jgi:hypothetical protein
MQQLEVVGVGLSMAGSLPERDGFVRAGLARGGWLGPAVAEGVGELPSQPLVLAGEFPVPRQNCFQPGSQGGIRSALAGWHGRGGLGGGVPEALDFGADVGLGVEPRIVTPRLGVRPPRS